MKKKGREKEYMREYMRKTRNNPKYQKYTKQNSKKIIDRRHVFKKKAIEIKGGRCQRCGNVFDEECYDFHHTEPVEKDLNIAKALTEKTWGEIERELEKCILVCANCHRIIHKEEKYSHLKKDKKPKVKIQIELF
jgi:hypothetical protein